MRYGEKVSDCRGLYKGCKDLNEYLQQRINKQNNNKLKSDKMMKIMNNNSNRGKSISRQWQSAWLSWLRDFCVLR